MRLACKLVITVRSVKSSLVFTALIPVGDDRRKSLDVVRIAGAADKAVMRKAREAVLAGRTCKDLFVALADRIDVIGFKSVARQLVFIGNRSDLVGC